MGVVLVPFPKHEKSERELREEMKMDARFQKAVEEDMKRQEGREKEMKKKVDDEYEEARKRDPWQYQILPEGWSIFGTGLMIIDEI